MKRTKRRGWLALGLNLAVSLALLGAIVMSLGSAEATHGGTYDVEVDGEGTRTLVITVSGHSTPGEGNEISHFEFSVCNGAQFQQNPTVTGSGTGPYSVVSAGAGSSYDWKVDTLQDDDLPLTITLTFSDPVAGLSGAFVKTGGGSDAGLTFQFSCDPRQTPTPTPSPEPDGTLRIVKDVVNDDGGSAVPGDFTFSVTGPKNAHGNPDTVIDSDSASIEFTLPPGTYSVTETGPSGYTMTDFECVEGDTENSITDPNAVVVHGGFITVCTVVNDDFSLSQTGALRIVKRVINDDAGTAPPSDFDFEVTGPNGYDENPQPGNVQTIDNTTTEGEIDLVGLEPGTYTVTEVQVDGYTLTSVTCDPDATTTSGQTFTVDVTAGGLVECLVVNDDAAEDEQSTPTPTPTSTSTPTPTPTPTSTPTPPGDDNPPQSDVQGINNLPQQPISEVAGISNLPQTGDPMDYPWALLTAFGGSLISLGFITRRYFFAA